MKSLLPFLLYILPCFGQFTPWSKFGPEIIGSGPIIHSPPELIKNPKYAEALEHTPLNRTPDWFKNWKVYQQLMTGHLEFNWPIGPLKSTGNTGYDPDDIIRLNNAAKVNGGKVKLIGYNTGYLPRNEKNRQKSIGNATDDSNDYRELFNEAHDNKFQVDKVDEYAKLADEILFSDLLHPMEYKNYKRLLPHPAYTSDFYEYNRSDLNDLNDYENNYQDTNQFPEDLSTKYNPNYKNDYVFKGYPFFDPESYTNKNQEIIYNQFESRFKNSLLEKNYENNLNHKDYTLDDIGHNQGYLNNDKYFNTVETNPSKNNFMKISTNGVPLKQYVMPFFNGFDPKEVIQNPNKMWDLTINDLYDDGFDKYNRRYYSEYDDAVSPDLDFKKKFIPNTYNSKDHYSELSEPENRATRLKRLGRKKRNRSKKHRKHAKLDDYKTYYYPEWRSRKNVRSYRKRNSSQRNYHSKRINSVYKDDKPYRDHTY